MGDERSCFRAFFKIKMKVKRRKKRIRDSVAGVGYCKQLEVFL